jgi:hypothetical protein
MTAASMPRVCISILRFVGSKTRFRATRRAHPGRPDKIIAPDAGCESNQERARVMFAQHNRGFFVSILADLIPKLVRGA